MAAAAGRPASHCTRGRLHCTSNRNYVFKGKELRGLSPNSYIHVSLWAIYLFPGSIHIFSCSRIGRPIVGLYINRAQTHECRNWDRAPPPPIPFLGICVSNFRYCVFAVCPSARLTAADSGPSFAASSNLRNSLAGMPAPIFPTLRPRLRRPSLKCLARGRRAVPSVSRGCGGYETTFEGNGSLRGIYYIVRLRMRVGPLHTWDFSH